MLEGSDIEPDCSVGGAGEQPGLPWMPSKHEHAEPVLFITNMTSDASERSQGQGVYQTSGVRFSTSMIDSDLGGVTGSGPEWVTAVNGECT